MTNEEIVLIVIDKEIYVQTEVKNPLMSEPVKTLLKVHHLGCYGGIKWEKWENGTRIIIPMTPHQRVIANTPSQSPIRKDINQIRVFSKKDNYIADEFSISPNKLEVGGIFFTEEESTQHRIFKGAIGQIAVINNETSQARVNICVKVFKEDRKRNTCFSLSDKQRQRLFNRPSDTTIILSVSKYKIITDKLSIVRSISINGAIDKKLVVLRSLFSEKLPDSSQMIESAQELKDQLSKTRQAEIEKMREGN